MSAAIGVSTPAAARPRAAQWRARPAALDRRRRDDVGRRHRGRHRAGGLRAAASRRTTRTCRTSGLAWVGPSGGHLLGFDFEGRDVLSRLLAGAQSSMLGPLAVVVGAMVLGTLIAVVAAWRQGLTDTVALLRPGHPVRLPRHPARGAGRRRLRRRPDGRRGRAVHRLHAVRRPRAARRRAEGARPALRRRPGGAGCVGAPPSACGTSCRTCCR